jgi:hypothetical protein
MKKTIIALCAAAGVFAAAAAPALAHHSFAMFDSSKMYVWEGVVVRYEWKNPHSMVIIRVPPGAKDPATVGTWEIEGAATNIMARQGWNKTSYKPGDRITVVGQPMRDGSKAGSLYYALKDGKRLYHDVNRNGGPGASGRGVPAGFTLP